MSKFKRERPTIGILPGWSAITGQTTDHYLASVLEGIQSAARIRSCNLLLAWGLGRVSDVSATHTAWPVVAPDSDFVPVGPWNTDGLIIFAPLLHESRSRYLEELGSGGFPLLFIASGAGSPMVTVDNAIGIEQAIKHLMDHGHRRIGFIAGDPGDDGDSQSRLRAYQAAVAEYQLELDPRLVEPGWHNFDGGYEATRKIMASGVEFSALLASDDASAIGAMSAVREAGRQIPGDVAVVGFDDQPDAMAQVPPLTSVHTPLAEMGQQALMLMWSHLVSNEKLESLQLPTWLVARQSCGCLPDVVASAIHSRPRAKAPAGQPAASVPDLAQIKAQLVNEMVAVLPSQSRFPYGERSTRLCASLVNGFYTSLEQRNPVPFQMAFVGFLSELELGDETINPWQAIFSALRHHMTQLPAAWKRAETRLLAENLLHQARAAVGESAQRQDNRHRYQQDIAAQSLSELNAMLSTTLNEQEAVKTLETHITTIGVRHARVALFGAEGDDPVAWSVMLNSQSGSASLRFRSREFPPPSLYPPNEALNLALVPLVFQEERLGYVAFDADNLGPCANIARQFAASLKVSRLHAQVIELSLTDPLTGIYNRRYFDLFLRNEIDRSRRFQRGLAVIMLDIDHFKRYNDAFGHPAGDRALQAVASCLQERRRSADVLARIGGEEFALILPETDAEGALKVAERIRAAMSAQADLKRQITLSMGISILSGTAVEAEEFMQRADLALYEAKKLGRNRICVFQEVKSADGKEAS
jgi:diguanylate cyclase (GGDEF)-like protein